MTRRRDLLKLTVALPVSTIRAAPYARSKGEHDTLQDRTERIMRTWDEIGYHRTGTTGDETTARWLADEIEATGLTAEIDTFDFVRLNPTVAHLTLDEASVEGLPCFDAPGTAHHGISGRLVPLGEEGEIGLLSFEPTGTAAGALIEARRTTTHRALVAVCAGKQVAPGLAVSNADSFGTPFGPPVLQVATQHRPLLEDAARRQTRVTLTAHMDSEPTTASNVATTVPGSEPTLAPLVIMTPRSAWWQCTSERGGGLVAWLECLRHFMRQPPRRTVRFTANTGHELGHLGLDRFLEAQPSLIGDAHCWVHLGANFAAQDGSILYQASDQPMMEAGIRALEDAGQPPDATVPAGTRPFGEARNIFDGSGRYVSLLGSNPLFHHPADRWPDAVNLQKTVQLTRAMVRLADQLANAEATKEST